MEQQLINIERKFRPEIEGLRVVAALLVAVYHIWFNRVSGGVDVFFVISGFLITTSIISTINRTGEFRFWPYISKLLKRLYPSLLFILGVVIMLSIFFLPISIMDKTIREVIASMFYYQNWQLAISSTDYLDASQMKTPVEHFWALSIQGQFYIIWFLLFTFILGIVKKAGKLNTRHLFNVILGTLFIMSLTYSIYLTKVNQPWAYFITFTRVWEFALGGLLCVNLSYIKINKMIATVIGWAGLLGLIFTGVIFNVSEMFPGYIALWPMLCAFLIIVSGTQETKFSVKSLLGSPIMVKLGGISFGIYLWHWVLLQFYRYNIQEIPGVGAGVLIILSSVILSYLMTQFIENPIRNSKSNRKAFKKLVLMATVNIVLIIAVLINGYISQLQLKQQITDIDYPGAMAIHPSIEAPAVDPIPNYANVFDDLPLAHLDGSNQGLRKSDLKIGEYGELDNYDFTIAIIGSSHTEHWQGAVLEATKDYNYRVLNITRSATRFSNEYPDDDMKGIWIQHVLDYLNDADTDIDLIISQATASDKFEEETHRGMTDMLEYVFEEHDIDILAVRDNPRYSFNILESLELDGEMETIDKMNAENSQKDEEFWRDFEKENTTLYKTDLTEYFKIDDEFRPIIGNVVIYRDNRHLTNSYSKTFGPIFEELINDILQKNNAKK